LKNCSLQEVAQATSLNFERLFPRTRVVTVKTAEINEILP